MVPTKSNLKSAINILKLSKSGYELLDRKRNILIRELLELTDSTKKLQTAINIAFKEAYSALKTANLELGIDTVQRLSLAIKIEDGLEIKVKSVMGTEIPIVSINSKKPLPAYGFKDSTSSLDEAMLKFTEVKKATGLLAETETSVIRLADSIKKTQKRANALKNIIIPKYEKEITDMLNALEEKDREEFSRLKVIKELKTKEI